VILLPNSVRVYVSTAPMNLRKSFEGLSNEVRGVLSLDPLSGHVFLFLNRRRTQVKMLVFTRGGFPIVHKRLERGRFTFPERVTPRGWRSTHTSCRRSWRAWSPRRRPRPSGGALCFEPVPRAEGPRPASASSLLRSAGSPLFAK